MEQTATNRGFTLIESMIAILLLSLIMLWALEGLMGAYIYVDRNTIRDEAVRISDEELTAARNTAYTSLSAGTTNSTITRQIRSHDVTYDVDTVVTNVSPIKSVEVTVSWTHRGTTYTYVGTTVKGDI